MIHILTGNTSVPFFAKWRQQWSAFHKIKYTTRLLYKKFCMLHDTICIRFNIRKPFPQMVTIINLGEIVAFPPPPKKNHFLVISVKPSFFKKQNKHTKNPQQNPKTKTNENQNSKFI